MKSRLKIRDRSTLPSVFYIFEYAIWIVVAYINYNSFCFIPLDGYTVSKSQKILVLSILLSSIIGAVVRWHRCMSTRRVAADIMIGLGTYTMLAYNPYYSRWFTILTIMFFTFTIAYIVCIFSRKVKGRSVFQIRNRDKRNFILKNRFLRIFDAAGLCMGLLMTILLVPIVYNTVVNHGIMVADETYVTTGFDINYTENEWSLTSNLDVIEKIRENARWEPLTTEEKLQVLQVICNCEENYFGLDCHITMVMDDLPEPVLGYYEDSEQIVVIDRQHLEQSDADEVLRTCLHEMYHAWEFCLVRLYLDSTDAQKKMRVFLHCEEYIDEIVNYKDGGDDVESYMEYYCQHLEEDSRDYAEEMVYEYYREIDYLQGNLEEYGGLILD